MRRYPILLLLAAALAGCGSNPQAPRSGLLAPSQESLLADAGRAAAAGQYDKAQAALRAAIANAPADKTPWLQLAQLKFDQGEYDEAIANAQQALDRDPNDKQALSIVAVAGLRLSVHSLAELRQQSGLGGSLRSEAQELAKMLRATLGEEVLVPSASVPRVARRPVQPVRSAPPGRSAPPASNSADPFGALK